MVLFFHESSKITQIWVKKMHCPTSNICPFLVFVGAFGAVLRKSTFNPSRKHLNIQVSPAGCMTPMAICPSFVVKHKIHKGPRATHTHRLEWFFWFRTLANHLGCMKPVIDTGINCPSTHAWFLPSTVLAINLFRATEHVNTWTVVWAQSLKLFKEEFYVPVVEDFAFRLRFKTFCGHTKQGTRTSISSSMFRSKFN